MALEPRLELCRCQARERGLADARRQVEANCLLIRQPRPRPKTAALVIEPTTQKLRDGLPLVRHDSALLDITQYLRQFSGDVSPRFAVDCLAPALTISPPEVNARHPTAIR